jgi:hypothetical protein
MAGRENLKTSFDIRSSPRELYLAILFPIINHVLRILFLETDYRPYDEKQGLAERGFGEKAHLEKSSARSFSLKGK